MTTKVTTNLVAVAAFLRQPEMVASLAPPAEKIGTLARQEAEKHVDTGYYFGKIEVRRFRNYYQVRAGDWAAFMVEYGNSKVPAYAPMRTAARASGFKFTEQAKATGGDDG